MSKRKRRGERATNDRAVLLARVSSREQADGYSLDAQMALLREYATRQGLDVAAEHRITESASGDMERRQFNAILADLRRIGAPRHLVVEKSDRSERNMRDMVALDDLRSAGVTIHFAKESWRVGPSASVGDMDRWEIQSWLSRRHSRNLSEETRKGMREKAKQGGWGHLAPIGYLNRSDEHRSWLEEDPERAPLVRLLFQQVAAEGMTCPAAAAFAKSIGLRSRSGRALDASAIQKMLRHPLYVGRVESGDVSAVAEVDAIIDAATWAHVQEMLTSRAKHSGPRARDREEPRLFSGLLKCAECGRTVTSEEHGGRHGKGSFVYWRCASGARSPCTIYMREDRLVAQFAARLDRLRMPTDAVERARADMLTRLAAEEREKRESLRRIGITRQRLDESDARALAGFVDGAIDKADLKALRGRLAAQRAEIDMQADALAGPDRDAAQLVDDVMAGLLAAGAVFLARQAVRRPMLMATMTGAVLTKQGVLVPRFVEPFAAVERAASAIETLASGRQLKRGSHRNETTSLAPTSLAPTGSGGGI